MANAIAVACDTFAQARQRHDRAIPTFSASSPRFWTTLPAEPQTN